MPISEALKRVYASAPTDTRYIECLSMWHPNWGTWLHFTNDVQAWTFAIESGALVDFAAVPFSVVLPLQDGKGQQDLQIGLENVGREAMDYIESASFTPAIPIQVIYRVYLDRPHSSPQMVPSLDLTLSNVVVGLDVITGTATRADTLNRPFPSEVYRLDTYPGLDR